MQAFEGITVLDLTHVLAGPFATYQLAVLGANIIKIEAPNAPDMNRQIGPAEDYNDAYMGTHFQSQAANKSAITLNLKTEAGKKIFLSLAAKADVLVENYRTGAMDRLGLGYDDIKEINPTIIYCSITGFGQTGPKASHGAFDNVIQAYSGMMMATGEPDGPGVLMGPPVLDYGTGAQAAFAISSALFRRGRMGEGQRLDVAMLDCAMMMQACYALNHDVTGKDPVRQGRNAGNWVAGYGCYEAAEDMLMVGAFTPQQHARIWRAVGREDLATEVEQQKQKEMPERQERDKPLLAEIIRSKTADEWEAIFNEAGVPASRLRTVGEALASEQVKARAVVGHLDANEQASEAIKPVVAGFMATPDGPVAHSRPPEMGRDTDLILRDLGYSDAEISDLRNEGAI